MQAVHRQGVAEEPQHLAAAAARPSPQEEVEAERVGVRQVLAEDQKEAHLHR